MKSRRSSPTLRSRLLPLLAGRIGAVGANAETFLRELGLPPTLPTQGESETPVTTVREAFESAEAYLRDPFVGLNLGRNIEHGRYGIVEFAARSAPNGLEAMSRMLRYQRLINNLAVFSIERDGARLALDHCLPSAHNALGRQANEYTVASVLARGRLLLNHHLVPSQVWFPHAEPHDVGELIGFFGTENITFNAATSGMTLDATILERPLPTADEALLDLLDRYAGTLLPPDERPVNPLVIIRTQIRRSVGRGQLSLAAVASAMRTSPRTLQRQLEASNATFQGLLDEVRRDLAFEYLRDSSRTVHSVAVSLGYSDGRAFLRAFRRWSGSTPMRYRARALAAARRPT